MRSRVRPASAVSTRTVCDDWAMLPGRPGVGPPRPAALQGRAFDFARGSAGVPAEMPVVRRSLADGCDGCGLLGSWRGLGVRDARGVLGCSRGVRRGIDHSASRVRACASVDCTEMFAVGVKDPLTLGSVPVIGQTVTTGVRRSIANVSSANWNWKMKTPRTARLPVCASSWRIRKLALWL